MFLTSSHYSEKVIKKSDL